MPTGVIRVRLALEDSVVNQAVEPLGQHRLGDVEMGLELAEAPDAVHRVAHDQERPTLAYHLERGCDRAVLLAVVELSEHRRKNCSGLRFNHRTLVVASGDRSSMIEPKGGLTMPPAQTAQTAQTLGRMRARKTPADTSTGNMDAAQAQGRQ